MNLAARVPFRQDASTARLTVDSFRHLAVRECDQCKLRASKVACWLSSPNALDRASGGRAQSIGSFSFWGSAARRTLARVAALRDRSRFAGYTG